MGKPMRGEIYDFLKEKVPQDKYPILNGLLEGIFSLDDYGDERRLISRFISYAVAFWREDTLTGKGQTEAMLEALEDLLKTAVESADQDTNAINVLDNLLSALVAADERIHLLYFRGSLGSQSRLEGLDED